jgi:hypothetical protein
MRELGVQGHLLRPLTGLTINQVSEESEALLAQAARMLSIVVEKKNPRSSKEGRDRGLLLRVILST